MWSKPDDNVPLAGGLAGGKDCFKGWFGVTSKGLKGAGLLTTGADFDLKNFEGGFLVGWTATGTTGTEHRYVFIRFCLVKKWID